MCIQHQVETSKGHETFIDFLMVAEETFDHEGGGVEATRIL